MRRPEGGTLPDSRHRRTRLHGDADGAAVGIEFGAELMRFAESLASGAEALERHREVLLDAAGPAVLVDAAGVAASFQRMTRIADAIGIPADDMMIEMGRQVRDELDIERFASARNTLDRAQAVA